MAMKLFVASNLMAPFSCPKCGKSRYQDVSRFFKDELLLKISCRCSCRYKFRVILERRRSVRKEVCLEGYLKKVHLKQYMIQILIKYAVTVENLSRHGFRIKLAKQIPLTEGESILVEFNQDNLNRPKVSKAVQVIKMLSPSDVCCEFLFHDHHKNLGDYLLYC